MKNIKIINSNEATNAKLVKKDNTPILFKADDGTTITKKQIDLMINKIIRHNIVFSNYFTFDNYKNKYPNWLSSQEIKNEYVSYIDKYPFNKLHIFNNMYLGYKLYNFTLESEPFCTFVSYLFGFITNNLKNIENKKILEDFISEIEIRFFNDWSCYQVF